MFQRFLFAVVAVCIGSATLSALENQVRIENPSSASSGEHDEVLNGVRLYYRVAGASDRAPVVFLMADRIQQLQLRDSGWSAYLKRI